MDFINKDTDFKSLTTFKLRETLRHLNQFKHKFSRSKRLVKIESLIGLIKSELNFRSKEKDKEENNAT